MLQVASGAPYDVPSRGGRREAQGRVCLSLPALQGAGFCAAARGAAGACFVPRAVHFGDLKLQCGDLLVHPLRLAELRASATPTVLTHTLLAATGEYVLPVTAADFIPTGADTPIPPAKCPHEVAAAVHHEDGETAAEAVLAASGRAIVHTPSSQARWCKVAYVIAEVVCC